MWGAGQSQRGMCSKPGTLISMQTYLFTLGSPEKQRNSITALGGGKKGALKVLGYMVFKVAQYLQTAI